MLTASRKWAMVMYVIGLVSYAMYSGTWPGSCWSAPLH